jgi:hypothetical protein
VGTGGGKITATAGVFNTSPVVPFVNGTLFASLSTLSPVPLPGISGAVGINPSPLLINLGPISTTDADGVAFWSTTVPTPPPPGLVGFTLHIQALYSPVSGAGPVLSNNAYLRFK